MRVWNREAGAPWHDVFFCRTIGTSAADILHRYQHFYPCFLIATIHFVEQLVITSLSKVWPWIRWLQMHMTLAARMLGASWHICRRYPAPVSALEALCNKRSNIDLVITSLFLHTSAGISTELQNDEESCSVVIIVCTSWSKMSTAGSNYTETLCTHRRGL